MSIQERACGTMYISLDHSHEHTFTDVLDQRFSNMTHVTNRNVNHHK